MHTIQAQYQPENMYKMDEKGLIIGYSGEAKVISRARRRNPKVIQDGAREMPTVVERCGAGIIMLPSFVAMCCILYWLAFRYQSSEGCLCLG